MDSLSSCFYKMVLWNLPLDSEVIFAVVFCSLCSDFLTWLYIIITYEALQKFSQQHPRPAESVI